MHLRTATVADQDGILDLIGQVLAEYGDRISIAPGGAESDLTDLDRNYFQPGGMFWVLDGRHPQLANRITGSHAAVPDPERPEVCRLKRLYLARDLRGQGWGYQLMVAAMDWSWSQGFQRIEFWSDSRFQRAHRFFQNVGFVPTGAVRTMTDSHEPYSEREFFLERAPGLTEKSDLG